MVTATHTKKSSNGSATRKVKKRLTKPEREGLLTHKQDEQPAAGGGVEASAVGDSGGEGLRLIPCDAICASPFNPRQLFDDAALEQLGESLKAHGQLQPCVVRPRAKSGNGHGKARYELIAGERRWRAAQAAGLPGVSVVVRDVDDATAVELAGIENYRREDLNAIEQARWFKSMLDTAGYTQQKLAERLSISQGQVSNRLRLLDLPDGLRQMVISREIPATWARHLAAWTHRPKVLEAVEATFKKERPHTERECLTAACRAARNLTRPLSGYFNHQEGGRWVSGEVAFKPTKEQRDELDVEKMNIDFGGTQLRCWDVKLWRTLQDAGEKRRAAREPKRATGGAAGAAISPKQKAKQAADQFAKKIHRYKVEWLQRQCAQRIDGADQATMLRLLLHFCHTDQAQRDPALLVGAVRDAGGKVTSKGKYRGPETIRSLLTVDDDKLAGCAVALLKQWLVVAVEMYRSHLEADEVELVADALGVDLKRDWRLDEAFLGLHTIDQLRDLAKEWSIDTSDAKKRVDLVKLLFAAQSYVRAPKPLINAKAPKR